MNYYKKRILLLSIISFPILFGQFTYRKSTGAHEGSTGAPGDATCAGSGCHADASITKNDILVNSLIFPTADSTYVPGTTYKIILKVKNPGIKRFGFELVALKKADDKNVGTFKITESTRTHLLTHDVKGDTRTSVTHSLKGTPETPAGSNSNEWTFDWTAPANSEGEIVFYYATNNTNNNNANTGDKIYLSSFKIKPATNPNSISQYIDETSVIASYNSNSDQFILKYSLKNNKNITIVINDNLGRTIYNRTNIATTTGQQNNEITLGNNKLSKGIYFVNLIIDNTKISKKVFVN
ncbi:MAG: choice-of-anchor V domain-containing protein [Bacteroidia bacterium]